MSGIRFQLLFRMISDLKRRYDLDRDNMRTMNRAQLDKLISDHFMYEVTDDVEGELRTFTDDVR
jgi:hypothetical protein